MFSKNLLALMPLAMAVAAFLPSTLAEEFEYRVDPWGIPEAWSAGYPTLDAKAGDTINEWDQGKSLHFACDTADYCERGMSIVINVAAAPVDEWKEETPSPTKAPTKSPTAWPTKAPTRWPTAAPTYAPTDKVTEKPVADPTDAPTEEEIINDIVADAEPQTVELTWLIPENQEPYDPINVNVGDTLTFNMGAGHNVFIHPSQSCDKTDAIFIGDSAATSYTFKEEDGSPEGTQMFFACDVGPHCDLGMQIVVNVFNELVAEEPEPEPVEEPVAAVEEEPKTVSLEWLIPEDQLPFDPISVNVGDTLAFNMGPGHNVFIHPSLSCDPAGALFIGDLAETTYTFQPEDGSPAGKPMFFACDVGPHCDLGMQIAVNVFSTESTSSNNGGSSSSTVGAGAFDSVVSENDSSSASRPVALAVVTAAAAFIASALVL
ncbi:MAG: hypothetical protein SGARI_001180 [Bacillariaceae sp.]